MLRSLFVTLVFVAAVSARAGDAPVESFLRDFAIAAMGDDDPARVAAMWVEGPERDRVLSWFDRLRKTRCRRVIDVEITDVALRDGGAEAVVSVDFAEWNEVSSWSRRESRTYRAEVIRVDEAWRVARWFPAEDWVAKRICDAATVEERRAIATDAAPMIRAKLAEALTREAIDRINRTRFDEAAQLLPFARELAEGDPAATAAVLSAESVLLRNPNHRFAESLDTALRALSLAEETDDADLIANCLLRVARSQRFSDVEAAKSSLRRAFAMADAVENPTTVALVASQLARLHDDAGEYRSGVRFALEARRYAAMSGEPAALFSAEMNLAGSYVQIGDAVMAKPHYLAMVDIGRRAGYSTAVGLTRLALLQAFGGDAKQEEAIVADLLGRNEGREARGKLLLLRATWCFERGETAETEQYVFEAMREPRRSEGADDTWSMLAGLRFQQGRYDEAAGILDAAVDAATPQEFITRSLARLKAGVLRATGRRDEAIAILRKEIDFRNHAMDTTPFSSRQFRIFVKAQRDVHESLVWLLVEAGRLDEALVVTNAWKARMLRMRVQGAPLDSLPASVLAEKTSAETSVVEINRALRSAKPDDDDTIARLQDDLVRVRTDLQRLELLAQPAPAEPQKDELSAFVTREGTVGLQFLLGTNETLLFTFEGATKESLRIRCHRIAVPDRELLRKVQRFVSSLEQRDPGWRPHAEALYSLLLAPAQEELSRATSVIVLPQGALWGVPFHALVDPSGHVLIERASVEYRPAMAIGTMKRTSAPDDTLLAFANPIRDGVRSSERKFSSADLARSLPDAEVEAAKLRALYTGERSRVHVGLEAQESRFKEEGPRARIVHIATHAFADPEWPMYSALVLARPQPGDGEDGILEAREIAAMTLRADVAVLSGCETARGEYDLDEGVVGLPWAFLAAGTSAVVVSQWNVASQSTAELMVEFHSRLRRRGTTPAEALRGAQRALRARPRYAHPFYWAPFVAIAGR